MTELKDTNLNEEILQDNISDVTETDNDTLNDLSDNTDEDMLNNSLDNTDEDMPSTLSDFTDNSVQSYTKLSDKYNDIMSSATTMMFVGFAGIIFMILAFVKIIPLPLNPETAWLFNSVMGGVFVIFIIAGIVSFMHAKKVKIDANEEDALIKEILDWADTNISISEIDKNADLTQPEEILYFSRSDFIKDSLMHQFENADEPLIIELTEQIYQKLYESE